MEVGWRVPWKKKNPTLHLWSQRIKKNPYPNFAKFRLDGITFDVMFIQKAGALRVKAKIQTLSLKGEVGSC
jgi:hypothetical protein